METKFRSIREALDYAVAHLIPKRHSYIVEMRGPDGFSAGQFVDQSKVFNDGDVGLTLYLPFDAAGGESARLTRFLQMPVKDQFALVPWDGIPCYAACFGTDAVTAETVAWQVASTLYYNADSMDLECTVYDEGPVEG